jgi:serine/threonine-protein kinase
LVSQLGHHLSSGVTASHHANVIHRDLKLGNIIAERLNGFFYFKITDFGIAKLAEIEFDENLKDSSTMMTSSTIVGAIPFMAPELIKSSQNASFKSDVWSLGAIIYTCLTGNAPFGSNLEAVNKILSHDSTALPTSDYGLFQYSSLVASISNIVTQCLQRDPSDRPTADEVKAFFADLCYMNSPRSEGIIRIFPLPKANAGFITNNMFFHRNSFFGSDDDCTAGTEVLYGSNCNCGNRVHPVIPLK